MDLKVITGDFSICKVNELNADLLKKSLHLLGEPMKNFHWYAERKWFLKNIMKLKVDGNVFELPRMPHLKSME